jgi:general L-amino acid transport system substrate-binding protein
MLLRTIFVLSLIATTAHELHASSPTVDSIRKAGALVCGIDQSEAEFSMTDEHGSRVAFDHDLCKAVAAAILGKPARVIDKGYPDEETALEALRKKEVDMVASVSDDFSHSTLANIGLSRPVLFDGESFLVSRASGVKRASGLSGRKICFLAETETELNLRSWFEQRRLDFVPFPFQEEGEMEAAYVTANCAALAGDLTRLANIRVAFGHRAKDYTFLPEIIARDPLASAYRRDDPGFGNIVDWTINVLLLAEELGVTAQNARVISHHNAATGKLLDEARVLERPLGLDDRWTIRVIESVGNYGELFRRDLGEDSALKLPRVQSTLWNHGGLMQGLPLK